MLSKTNTGTENSLSDAEPDCVGEEPFHGETELSSAGSGLFAAVHDPPALVSEADSKPTELSSRQLSVTKQIFPKSEENPQDNEETISTEPQIVNDIQDEKERRMHMNRSTNWSDNVTHPIKTIQNTFEHLWIRQLKKATEEFRLQVATVPASMAQKFDFERSQRLQKELLNKILRDHNGVCRLTILDKFHVDHEVVLRNGFSLTDRWGLEPNFSIVVKGTKDQAFGAAALLGEVFGQAAIGIYCPLTKTDVEVWTSSQGRTLPDGVHRVVTVRPDGIKVMTPELGREIIIPVQEEFIRRSQPLSDSESPKYPSGEVDILGSSIDFHDYDASLKDFSAATIEQILEKTFFQRFPVTESPCRSDLLFAEDYETAFNQSGLHSGGTIASIQLARDHALSFSSI